MLVACLGRIPRFDLKDSDWIGSESSSIDETEKKVIGKCQKNKMYLIIK
jgi:hypothetical protein